ncbi:MAG: hypothetical protein EBU30_06575 [Synechococcaceae bacterium WB6_3B_236]|nr:hypothetical protein [Synechococcaceae bacterium WB6_3B_236]
MEHDGGILCGSGSTAVGIEQVMENPLWLLLPWAVFAVAAGIKFWRLNSLFRKHLLGIPSRTERLRQMLERIWERDHQLR